VMPSLETTIPCNEGKKSGQWKGLRSDVSSKWDDISWKECVGW
jgi:hypothetical protein